MSRDRRRAPRMAAVALLALAAGAFGYYPFVHYTSGTAPYGVAPEKFDLNALPGRTVHYFVSGRGPETLAQGDSFASVLSQIRAAAKAWGDVATSDLRFEFGGFAAGDVPQTTPGVDVYFGEIELPPGLIALGGPTTRASLTSGDDGAFVPITRSILVLGKDLSQRPSHSDAFFLTVVHELGHALGLQHSLVSGAMSTEITRSVTRAHPLAADDVAGISLLYPAAGFEAKTGSISGRVTLGGAGVHMASVVALDPAGRAISALSEPDGSYQIRGLSPGQYYLYAHPLPPALQDGLGPADIVLPVGVDGQPVAAGPLFETVFYPGVKQLAGANIVTVKAGKSSADFDFAVQARGALDLYSVTTYSFPGNYAVKPAFLNMNGTRKWLVAYGNGLMSNGAPVAGLSVAAVGSGATVLDDGLKGYAPDPRFLQVSFGFNPFAGEGPRHLVFTRDGNIFVLPAALHLVRSQPPVVASVTPGADSEGRAVAVLAGSNLTARARVLFDGVAGTVRSLDETTGALTVTPPAGASGHHAAVTVVDADGQNSLFLNPSNPARYQYAETGAPGLWMTPDVLPAGSESMVEIVGIGTQFASGATVAGFGTSDVAVRSVWVTGPDRLLVNVHVSENAAESAVPLTVATGLQAATLPSALRVGPANPGVPVVTPTPVNPETSEPSVYAGGKAAIPVQGLAGGAASSVAITVDGVAAAALSVENGIVTFEIPAGVDLGPAVLRLTSAGIPAAPVVIAVDAAPPAILAITDLSGVPVTAARPAAPGDTLLATVTGLADDRVLDDLSLLAIMVGGVAQTPQTINASRMLPGAYDVRFDLSADVAASAAAPVTVGIGHRVSLPVTISVKAAK